MTSYQAIIIGGGFAGLATGCALLREGLTRVLILEQERRLGVHASGRNAGMIRQAPEELAIAPFAREGAAGIRERGVPFEATGSLLLGAQKIPRPLHDTSLHEALDRSSALQRFPHLERFAFEEALFTPSDGVVDVAAFLQGLKDEFRRGGGALRMEARVRSIAASSSAVRGVELEGETLFSEHVVNVAGAWGGDLGNSVGAPVALEARRRHLAVTDAIPSVDLSPRQPWVWDIDHEFYLRARSDGFLWCACDNDNEDPGESHPDPGAIDRIRDKVSGAFPEFSRAPVRQLWAGQRTFTPDGHFLLGADPRLPGLHWLVGLGGHGVTVATAVARRVARGVVAGGEPGSDGLIPREHAFRSQVCP